MTVLTESCKPKLYTNTNINACNRNFYIRRQLTENLFLFLHLLYYKYGVQGDIKNPISKVNKSSQSEEFFPLYIMSRDNLIKLNHTVHLSDESLTLSEKYRS